MESGRRTGRGREHHDCRELRLRERQEGAGDRRPRSPHGAEARGSGWCPVDPGAAFRGSAIPLRLRLRPPRRAGAGRHRPPQSAGRPGRHDSASGRLLYLPGADVRVCCGGRQGSGHPRRGESREAVHRPEVRRRWTAQRCSRRQGGLHQRKSLRLHRRRRERPEGASTDVARGDSRQLRIQPEACAAGDRNLQDARSGAGPFEGTGSRPGRG